MMKLLNFVLSSWDTILMAEGNNSIDKNKMSTLTFWRLQLKFQLGYKDSNVSHHIRKKHIIHRTHDIISFTAYNEEGFEERNYKLYWNTNKIVLKTCQRLHSSHLLSPTVLNPEQDCSKKRGQLLRLHNSIMSCYHAASGRTSRWTSKANLFSCLFLWINSKQDLQRWNMNSNKHNAGAWNILIYEVQSADNNFIPFL